MTNLDLGLRGEPLELRIFVPGRPTSPNRRNRSHWAPDAKRIEAERKAAKMLGIDARNRSGFADFFPIPVVELDFVFHLARVAGDLDNLLAGSKATIDGLVDAGVLAGDTVARVARISLGWTKAVGIEGSAIIIREIRP